MSLFHDLDAPRGLYACEGRKAQVVAQFADALEAHGTCAENIGAVCMDMSASYQAGVCEHRPWVAITFDEFVVIQPVNKAVDEVRRQEVKRAPELRRTRYIWFKDKHAWSNRQKAPFAELKRRNLKNTVASGSRRCYARASTTLRARRKPSRSSTDGTARRTVAAWSRSKRWPRRLRSTGQASQCVRFQVHQRPYRGGQFAHPGRQSQGP